MSKHTPGPWTISSLRPAIIGRDGYVTVADVVPQGQNALHEPGECDANAALIAAAPELLAALQALLPVAEAFERQASKRTGGRRGGPVFERARAAIAKAEGRS